jgi:hypothetical protein
MIDTIPLPGSTERLSTFGSFLWAAGGSFALEGISLHNEIRAERPTGLPRYYRSRCSGWFVSL